MSRILNRIKECKIYAHEIGLEKGGQIKVLIDFVISRILYGLNAEDYFIVGNGYTMSKYEKKRFFTIKKAFWLMDTVNDSAYIHFLENKAEALELFKDLVSRNWLYAPKSTFDDFMGFVKKTPVFIAKPVGGMCGVGIEKYNITNESSMEELKTLYNRLVTDDMLCEECLKTHDDIYLGTTALSTFRIFSMIDKKGDVHVLKAKFRAGIGDAITDATDGCCIHYPVSIQYGVIEGPGINETEKRKDYFYHPGCDKLVVGMKIPKWDRVLEVVTEAAKKIPQVRYVGWDIAVTNNSVELIEGNHNPYYGTFEIMGIERLWWPRLKSLI